MNGSKWIRRDWMMAVKPPTNFHERIEVLPRHLWHSRWIEFKIRFNTYASQEPTIGYLVADWFTLLVWSVQNNTLARASAPICRTCNVSNKMLVSMMTIIENPHVIANIKSVPWAIPIVVLNVACVANIPRAIFRKRYRQALISSCLNIACLVAMFLVSTFPNLVYSTGDGATLTLYDAASSQGTLWLMCIIASIGTPLIVSYTVVIYWTFRHPIEMDTK